MGDVQQSAEVGDRPAAAGSALSSLRARREAAVKKLHLDLAVPRLDPPVYVRFRPIGQAEINGINARHAKSKAKDVDVVINAVSLATACLGVFDEVEGQLRSIDPSGDADDAPTFDERLAALLELPEGSTAVDVVRGLYLTDGDIIATGARLAQWSGYAWQDIERESEGN